MSGAGGGAGAAAEAPDAAADVYALLGGADPEGAGKKPVVVQGITGKFGSHHARLMVEYGTNVAAGVTPGKGGQDFDGIPIYDTVAEAVEATGAEISAAFVPARRFLPAARDALS